MLYATLILIFTLISMGFLILSIWEEVKNNRTKLSIIYSNIGLTGIFISVIALILFMKSLM